MSKKNIFELNLNNKYRNTKADLENKIRKAEENYNAAYKAYNDSYTKSPALKSNLDKADSKLARLNDKGRNFEKNASSRDKGIYYSTPEFDNLSKAVNKINENYIEKNKSKGKN